MRSRGAGRDDSDHFVGAFNPVRMDDYDDDDVFNHADRLPSLLAILNSLDKRHAEGVTELS
jgi:hypothetical protein